jgi:Gram-negative bacterial TonB protein C-terminal
MRLIKANIAGLTSPGQQSEMKSILAGTWPPLKPLPVFKYESEEYRATIDFDKKRGEWVCRKTSLPSNKVQELRGGLREITMVLPHGEAETFTEGAEQQEQELEKDANRRLQATHDWRENYESGARYFELRDYLSESQRTEIDDSLRLSLTARQLQFNSKNLAYVFDALSTAGGRFAALIEFAKRNKAKQGTGPQAQGEGAGPETERAMDHDKSLGISPREFAGVVNNPFVRDQEAAERLTDGDEFPAVSIKDVLPEQDLACLAERMAHTASQQFEIETSEVVGVESPSLVEHPHQEGHHSPAFSSFVAQVRTSQSFADHIEGSSSRFPALEISAFQVAVLALLFLFSVIAFTVGLRVGRGPLGRRLREAPKSMLGMDAKSPTLSHQADELPSRPPTPPVASSHDSAGTNSLDGATPSEEKSKESTRGSEYFAEVRSTDSVSAPPTESKPSAKPEVNSELIGAIGPVARNTSPRASSKLAHSRKAVGPTSSAPRSPVPYRLSSTVGAAPHLPRPSTILVTVPGRGSQPFRVSFPIKAIAATSSFAMTSRLLVLVSPESGPTVAHKPARLEGGELVSFVWPHYPRSGDRYGLAETIRVRATIGELGQVLEVKFLSGSVSLLPATKRAIRQWRYRPTLLDKRPVQAQQDVTIEFRPPQYSSRVSSQHPSLVAVK